MSGDIDLNSQDDELEQLLKDLDPEWLNSAKFFQEGTSIGLSFDVVGRNMIILEYKDGSRIMYEDSTKIGVVENPEDVVRLLRPLRNEKIVSKVI